MSPAPFVIAHRGASEYAPENTESAVRLALEQGAPAVECDVQLTRDGVAVVFHDEDLQRLCGAPARVSELDAADLVGRKVHVEGRTGEPHLVLDLAQWLALIPAAIRPVVELKPQATAAQDRVLADAAAALLAPRADAAVISFGLELVAAMRRHLPQHRVGPIRSRPPTPAEDQQLAEVAAGVVVLKHTLLSARRVGALVAQGREVWSYALDTVADVRRAVDVGVTGIISNRPDLAATALMP